MSAVTVQQGYGFVPAPRRHNSTPMRLTRRGRIALGTAIAVPLLFGAYLVGVGASQADAEVSVTTVSFEYVTVMPGDTLWTIAAVVAPDSDTQQVIDDIRSLNQLESSVVQPGQRIAIPVEYSNQ
ncbi:MAG: hypothetical protein RIS25_628 [Actinomycetota bacterium]